MLESEIQARCAAVAAETDLPVQWVRHHVDQRAGRPCGRCKGSGQVGHGTCFRCGGTGGRASYLGVEDALDWVRANVDRVRTLGQRRTANAPVIAARREHKRIVAAEAWKKDNYRLWRVVEDMLPCAFRDSIMDAVEAGTLTEAQRETLENMAAQMERRKMVAPSRGKVVTVRVQVQSARNWMDFQNQPVFRVEFTTAEGWAGRFETVDTAIIAKVQGRNSDTMQVRGVVVWNREGYAILGGQLEVDGCGKL